MSKKEKEKSAFRKGGNLKLKTTDSRGGAAALHKIKGDHIYELSKTKEILHEHLKKVLLYLLVSLDALESHILNSLLGELANSAALIFSRAYFVEEFFGAVVFQLWNLIFLR